MGLPIPEGRQADVVYLKPAGHHVILGTAGSGKSVMAIHRAIHLADPRTRNHGPTALLTFNKALTSYLTHLAGEHRNAISASTYAKFARDYLWSLGRLPAGSIAGPTARTRRIDQAVRMVSAERPDWEFFRRRTGRFFADELEWIDGHGVVDEDEYLAISRVGRGTPLQDAQRRAVWRTRRLYRELLVRGGFRYDWQSVPTAVRAALADDMRARRYRHIVVDEAQDLSPEAIRSLAESIQPGGSLTLFADYTQQIYARQISWRSCGLSVAKIETFIDNYRNSPQIARLALEMARMPHFRDRADLVEPETTWQDPGAPPELVRCASEDGEAHAVARAVARQGATARVGVFARTHLLAKRAAARIAGEYRELGDKTSWDGHAGVYVGTYHAAKGLEFDAVVLPYCGRARMPARDVVESFGPDEAADRESRLLYVGVTRARRDVTITYSGELTALLPGPETGLYRTGAR